VAACERKALRRSKAAFSRHRNGNFSGGKDASSYQLSQGKMYLMTTFAILWDYQIALVAWASLILPKKAPLSMKILN
jgi:hypothetical protein